MNEEHNDVLFDIVGIEKRVEDVIAAHSGPRIVLGRSMDGSLKPVFVSGSQWEMLYWIWRLVDDESVSLTDILLEYLQQ